MVDMASMTTPASALTFAVVVRGLEDAPAAVGLAQREHGIRLERPLLIPCVSSGCRNPPNSARAVLCLSGVKPFRRGAVEERHRDILPVHVGLPWRGVAVCEEQERASLHSQALCCHWTYEMIVHEGLVPCDANIGVN